MAVPVYVRASTGAAAAASATSWAVPHHATVVEEGEVAILHVTRRDLTSTVSTPAGWDPILGPNASTAHRSYIFGKVMLGTEAGTNVTLTISDATTNRMARIYYFKGASNVATAYWEGTATTTGTVTTIAAASVISAARNRLALSLL